MSRALIITYSILFQYIMDETLTHNIYCKIQTSKLEVVIGVVVSMSAS